MDIQIQINSIKAKFAQSKKQVETLRTERARLNLDGKDVTSIDAEIDSRLRDIHNFPAELALLEQYLAAEQQRIAQEEQDKLVEQQQKVVSDIESLSKKFIATLERANEVNDQLIAAITAETGLRQKTGKHLLDGYCHGSRQSLCALLEKSQREMDGIHTSPVGAGIIAGDPRVLL
jgi:predicted RNase H-like nuclease (RuvC/YqgF family)